MCYKTIEARDIKRKRLLGRIGNLYGLVGHIENLYGLVDSMKNLYGLVRQKYL